VRVDSASFQHSRRVCVFSGELALQHRPFDGSRQVPNKNAEHEARDVTKYVGGCIRIEIPIWGRNMDDRRGV
jgi:hypothetical protein